MKYLLITLFAVNSLFAANDFYYEFDKKVYIQENVTSFKSSNGIQEYKTTDGKIIKFKNEIVAQCKKDIQCIDDIKNLGINTIVKISSNFYYIKLNSSMNIFEYSQKIQELSSVQIAHPNFIKKRIFR